MRWGTAKGATPAPPPRRRLDKAAVAIWGDVRVSCLVVDLSDGKARLRVESDWLAPPSFYLYVQANQLVGRVRVTWRSARELGVEYLERPVRPSHHPDASLQGL